jgi:hypothetical protein
MTVPPILSFVELVSQLKKIPCDEIRKESDGYYEFVISLHHVSKFYPVFEKYFGPPFKPPGVLPSEKAKDVTKNYGGIQKQQTLYFADRNGVLNCAMIWPWGDGTRATVKMAQGVMA